MPPAPVRNRKHKPGQQHVVDAAMKQRRHPRQQRIRHGGRQRQPQMPGAAKPVARGIELVLHQQQRGQSRHPAPKRKLRDNAGVPRLRRQLFRPAPKRRPARRQRNRPPRRDRSPRRCQVRHQDPPRHPVDRKMMDRKPQPPGRSAPASNHTACTITPAAGSSLASAACVCAASSPRKAASSQSPAMPPTSTRRRQAAAATDPRGKTSSRHSSGSAATVSGEAIVSRSRSAS